MQIQAKKKGGKNKMIAWNHWGEKKREIVVLAL